MILRVKSVACSGLSKTLDYYPVQVEKFLARYKTLVAERGVEAVRAECRVPEIEAAEEFIAHAQAIRAERAAAAAEGRPPRLIEVINAWGGVTMAYRRRLVDAPGYTLNHEEVAPALEEGIRIADGLAPAEIEIDQWGQARGITMTPHVVDEAGSVRPTRP